MSIEDSPSGNSTKGPIYRALRVVVVGCGDTGSALSVKLSNLGNIVTVIDRNEHSFELLPIRRIETNRIVPIVGDGTHEIDLRKANLQEADILLALTGRDTINALSAQIGRYIFRVPKVICRINNVEMREMYQEIGLTIVTPSELEVDFLIDQAIF